MIGESVVYQDIHVLNRNQEKMRAYREDADELLKMLKDKTKAKRDEWEKNQKRLKNKGIASKVLG